MEEWLPRRERPSITVYTISRTLILRVSVRSDCARAGSAAVTFSSPSSDSVLEGRARSSPAEHWTQGRAPGAEVSRGGGGNGDEPAGGRQQMGLRESRSLRVQSRARWRPSQSLVGTGEAGGR